jgi:hypothetical protein
VGNGHLNFGVSFSGLLYFGRLVIFGSEIAIKVNKLGAIENPILVDGDDKHLCKSWIKVKLRVLRVC